DVSLDEAKKPITLRRWARVEGQLLLGSAPASQWSVQLMRGGTDLDGAPWVSFRAELKTDDNGRFVCDRCVPGKVRINPQANIGKYPIGIIGAGAFIELQPDKTATITLGGEGRPVIGRLVSADGGKID